MADFTESELLNAVARIFRAQLSSSKTGGTLNTDTEYRELREMVSIAFLMNPQAIFYLARLASNRLAKDVSREVAYIEDMLVALRDLGQLGKPFKDLSLLADANTTLLSLDAATSVTGRPETAKFSRIMDRVAASLRSNVVSTNGTLARPREESRNVIKADMESLKEVHSSLLTATFSIRDILATYLELDIPSEVASSAFRNVRNGLGKMYADLSLATDADNIALSREVLLNTLASKASVNLVADFADPSNIKYHGPTRPVPDTVNQAGTVGVCTPAVMYTTEAPWQLPLSTNQMVLAVDGGPVQEVDLSVLTAPMLLSDNEEDFEIEAGAEQLHVAIGPESSTHLGNVDGDDIDSIIITTTEGGPLRFRHIGCTIVCTDLTPKWADPWEGGEPSDLEYRCLVNPFTLQVLESSVFHTSYMYGGVTYYNVFVTGVASARMETAKGVVASHIGDAVFISSLSDAFEIVQVIAGSPTESVFIIDPRDQSTALSGLPAGDIDLVGSSDLSTSRWNVDRSFSGEITGKTWVVSPPVKTVELATGTKTAADLVEAIRTGSPAVDPPQAGAGLYYHVRPLDIGGRLALVPRGSQYLRIETQVHKSNSVVPGPAEWVGDPANESLGFPAGTLLDTRFDSNDLLLASDLVALINHDTVGITATVDEQTVASGTGLSVLAGTKTVQDATVGFGTSGVASGDLITIEGGQNAGTYRVDTVTSTQLTVLSSANFVGNETDLAYAIKKERVKISSDNTDNTTSVEFGSGPSEFGLPAGVNYGTSTEFKAVNGAGEYLSFDLAEDTDVLKLPGRAPIEIESVDGTVLNLETTIPSNLLHSVFTVRSKTGEQYEIMQGQLETFTTSANLLKKHKFDESVDAIDAAITSAVLPGQNFAASRNHARNLLNDLASILTDTYLRGDEHGVTLNDNSYTLSGILSTFTPDVVDALDKVIKMFRERRYDRAIDLLLSGDLNGFFGTDSETGSYEGAVMAASRTVIRDLPTPSSDQESVDEDTNVATGYVELTDADYDFTDSEDEYEVDDG